MPMLVKRVEKDGAWVPENLLRAADFLGSLGEANNPDWKTVAIDEATDEVVVPSGSAGFSWGEEGKWNLQEKDGCGNATRLRLTNILDSQHDEVNEEIGRANGRTPIPNAQILCRLLLAKKKNNTKRDYRE